MRSIGNDIISLQLTNPERTTQERFYSKIICKQELELFKRFDEGILSFEKFIWLAWGIKESVYKFYKRNNHQAPFSPTKIIIQKVTEPDKQKVLAFSNSTHENISFNKEECYCCEVRFDDHIFYTRSLVFDDIIFSVANNTNDFENVYWGIKNVDNAAYESQSERVRNFVMNKLRNFFPVNQLSIETAKAGYPFLKQQKDLPISFSHHGKYIAYSFIN